jgi:hypothetical protein
MNFTLVFSDEQLKIINEALVKMPFGLVAPLMFNINEQLQKQNNATQEKNL